jgi:pimeloyl-ACP methyl ester carboxylesterase
MVGLGMKPSIRREILKALLGLAVLPMAGLRSAAGSAAQMKAAAKDAEQGMGQDIVMVHGANAGGWCFDRFRDVFEGRGFTCHTPDLIGHGKDKGVAATALLNIGIADYRNQIEAFIKTLPTAAVLLGHSMGAVIVQQLAAKGLAKSLILVSPAPRAGILPPTDAEKQLDRDLMSIGPFWTKVLDPNFDLAKEYTLNRLPPEEQRTVFDQFGPESGRALFELFFWMFDRTGATKVETAAVRCPVLCLSGVEDRIVSLATARKTAAGYPSATYWEIEGHGHMLLVEPGAEAIADRIADWI